jgi:hypothetical protein
MIGIVKDKMPIAWTLKNPEDIRNFTWWDYAKIRKNEAIFLISWEKLKRLRKQFRSS